MLGVSPFAGQAASCGCCELGAHKPEGVCFCIVPGQTGEEGLQDELSVVFFRPQVLPLEIAK